MSAVNVEVKKQIIPTYIPKAAHDLPMFFENPEDIGDYDKIREDIFHEDQVHLNPVGYGLFMDFVRGLLDDLL